MGCFANNYWLHDASRPIYQQNNGNKIVLGVSSECILAQKLGDINWFVLHILLIKFSSVKKFHTAAHAQAQTSVCVSSKKEISID